MSKEHAYAYEAGYRDGSINYELEHCPACKNVADLQEALAENAKLRKILADACTYLCLAKMSGPLAVEVDKHNVYWDGEKILNRMRELRVEVDE